MKRRLFLIPLAVMVIGLTSARAVTPLDVDANTLSLYHFDELFGGQYANAASSSWPGTPYGSPTHPASQEGLGNCLSLDGTKDYVLIDGGILNDLPQDTFEAWVYVDSLDHYQPVLSKVDNGCILTDFLILVSQTGEFCVHIGSPPFDLYSPTNMITAKQWTRVAVTWDGSMVKLYVNDIKVAEKARTAPPRNSANTIRLGRHEKTDGIPVLAQIKIDEVRISKVARSFAPTGPTYYSHNFSTDPNWIVSNPANFHWNSADQTYGLSCPTQNGYAYARVHQTGSFRLAFDYLPVQTDWFSHMPIGLADDDYLQNDGAQGAFMAFAFGHDDSGYVGGLWTRSAGGIGNNQYIGYFYQVGIWYHVNMVYDATAKQLTAELRKKSDYSLVYSYTVTNLKEFTGMNNLGVIAWTEHGNANGKLDNIVFQSMVDPDIAWWRMVPSETNIVDSTGKNHTAKVFGNPAFTFDPQIGQNYVQFDGNSWLRIEDAPDLDLTNSWTIALWAKPGQLWNNTEYWLDKGCIDYPGGYGFIWSENKLNVTSLNTYAGPHAQWAAFGGSVVTGVWQQMVASYSSETKKISFYVNGVLASDSMVRLFNAAGSLTNTVPATNAVLANNHPSDPFLLIGSAKDWNQTINTPTLSHGALADIRIYGRALSASEVDMLFNTIPPFISEAPQSQIGYWGKTATFSVAAAGLGPFNYQWYQDGKLLPGATNNTLVLTNLLGYNAGSYTVRVSNGFAISTSLPAVLIVHPEGVSLHMYAGVEIEGVVGQTCSIQYTSSLNQPINWISLTTNFTLSKPVDVWIDMDSATQSTRFYKVTIP